MRNLINILEESEDHQPALRGEWHVLAWNGSAWHWSEAMDEDRARDQYTQQLRVAPTVASKLVCVATMQEAAGDDASALSVPAHSR